MEEIFLNAELRDIVGKRVKHLRREGQVPAVVYGHRSEPLSLKVQARELRQVLREAGANRLITLSIGGVAEPKRVLVRDLQRDVINRAMLHVDFYEVVMTEEITTELPIVFVGESLPVKKGEGFLFEGLDSIEIECLPGDLPPNIKIDLSQLMAVDQAILVRDLKLGDNIKILTDPEEVVVKVLPPAKEEVEEVVAVAPEAAPEVEIVGKKEKPEAEEKPDAKTKPEAKARPEAKVKPEAKSEG